MAVLSVWSERRFPTTFVLLGLPGVKGQGQGYKVVNVDLLIRSEGTNMHGVLVKYTCQFVKYKGHSLIYREYNSNFVTYIF